MNEENESGLSSSHFPSITELDEALKFHRKQRKKKFLDLTQCGPCCPCYNCTHPFKQDDWPVEDEATDNFALAFAHMRRGNRKLPDRPIITDVPKFVREFREVLAETRERSIKHAFLDIQLKLLQKVGTCLLNCFSFLVLLPLRPFLRRKKKRIEEETGLNDAPRDDK